MSYVAWLPVRASHLPLALRLALRRCGVRLTARLLHVHVRRQRMTEYAVDCSGLVRKVREYVISTSKFGVGQQEGSFKTPPGLHRVARKIGAGLPPGTVFKGRVPIGLTRGGMTNANICHRILWLEGLEDAVNRGGNVDSFARYIYIHGFGDELTLGRPASHGCIHMAASDLLPLFDRAAVGTLVWISM